MSTKCDAVGAVLGPVLDALYRAGIGPNCAFAKPCPQDDADGARREGTEITLFYAAQGMAPDRAETEGLRCLSTAKPGPKDAPSASPNNSRTTP